MDGNKAENKTKDVQGATGADGSNTGTTNSEDTNDAKQTQKPEANGTEKNTNTGEKKVDTVTMTQEELNALIISRSERAVEKALEENNSKETPEEVETTINSLKEELEELKAETLILGEGVKRDFVKDVYILAQARKGEDMKAKVKEVLELYPGFKANATNGGAIRIGNPATNQDVTEKDTRLEKIKSRMNL